MFGALRAAVSSSQRFPLALHFGGLVTVQLAGFVLPLLILPYVLRHIGSERFGLVITVQVLMQYVGILADFGHSFSATREIATHRQDPRKLARIFYATLAGRAALVPIWAVLVAAVVYAVPSFRSEWWVFAVGFLAVPGQALCPTWFFQGMGQVRQLMFATIASRLLSFVLIVLFVHSAGDYALVVLLQALAQLLTAFICLAFVIPALIVRVYIPSFRECFQTLRAGFPYLFAHSSDAIMRLAPPLMLGFVANNVAVTNFAIADKIATALSSLLIWPAVQLVYPRVCMLVGQSIDKAVAFMRRVFVLAAIASALMSLAIYVLNPLLVQIIGGEPGMGAVPVLAILAWFPFLRTIENVLGTNTMPAIGLGNLFATLHTMMCLGYLPCLLGMCYLGGAAGAAWAVLMMEVVFIVLLGFFLLHWRIRQRTEAVEEPLQPLEYVVSIPVTDQA